MLSEVSFIFRRVGLFLMMYRKHLIPRNSRTFRIKHFCEFLESRQTFVDSPKAFDFPKNLNSPLIYIFFSRLRRWNISTYKSQKRRNPVKIESCKANHSVRLSDRAAHCRVWIIRWVGFGVGFRRDELDHTNFSSYIKREQSDLLTTRRLVCFNWFR